jgi:hypothetical protein
MVLVSAFLLAAIAVYRDHRAGAGDTFHALWGVGVLSLLLSLLADFAPTVAGPFAALVVLGSLASGQTSIIDKLFGRSAPQTATTAHPSTTINTVGGAK